jgi:hypothetical protein
MREATPAGREPALERSCGTPASSTSYIHASFGLLCVKHKHKQPHWIFASSTRHRASSCKNIMHWWCERPWKIATHARLAMSTLHALLDRSVAKKNCAWECADTAHQNIFYKQGMTATVQHCPSSSAESRNPGQGCRGQPDRNVETGR